MAVKIKINKWSKQKIKERSAPTRMLTGSLSFLIGNVVQKQSTQDKSTSHDLLVVSEYVAKVQGQFIFWFRLMSHIILIFSLRKRTFKKCLVYGSESDLLRYAKMI